MKNQNQEVYIFGADTEDLEIGYASERLIGAGNYQKEGLEGKGVELSGELDGLPRFDLLIVEDGVSDAKDIRDAAAEVTGVNNIAFCYGHRVFKGLIDRLSRGPRSLVLDFRLMPGLEGISGLEEADYARKTLELYQELKKEDGWEPTVVIGLTQFEDEDEYAELVEALRKHGDDVFKKGDSDEIRTLLPKLIWNALEKNRLREELGEREAEVDAFAGVVDPDYDLVGTNRAFCDAKKYALDVAKADTSPPVLLTGELGTQKKNFAEYINDLSGRENVIPVNCASVTETELFGEAGSDAEEHRPGMIAEAENGTLFLDEIDKLDISSQGKLLHFLEKGEIRHAGIDTAIRVDNVQVIAASSDDLHTLVRDGCFIGRLYGILSAFTINLPPLRERREDIVPLAKHFLRQNAGKYNSPHLEGFDEDAKDLLKSQEWKDGNIQELRNTIVRTILLTEQEEPILTEEDLIIESSTDNSDIIVFPGNIKIPMSQDLNISKVISAIEWLNDLDPVIRDLLDAIPKITHGRIINKLDKRAGRSVSRQRISQLFSEKDNSSSYYEETKLLMNQNPNKWPHVREWRKQKGQQF